VKIVMGGAHSCLVADAFLNKLSQSMHVQKMGCCPS